MKRSSLRRALLMMIFLWGAARVPADDGVFGQGKPTSPVESSAGRPPGTDIRKEIARRLQSDPWSDRAWGVYWIGEYGLREFSMALSDRLQPVPPEVSREMALFYQVLLDSLIRLEATVPADRLLPHYQRFPDEVLILLAQSSHRNPTALLSLLQDVGPGLRWITICNLLAEQKAPGFSARLLRDLRIRVSVTVYDDHGYGGGVSGGAGCGAYSYGPADPADFPPIARYRLTDVAKGAVLVAPGRRPVYYVRYRGKPGKPDTIPPSREGGYGNADELRVEYLAALLDTAVADLPLKHQPIYAVYWTGPEHYRYEIARIRQAVQRSFEQVMEWLTARDLLLLSEAWTLKPNVALRISDMRGDTSRPLPEP